MVMTEAKENKGWFGQGPLHRGRAPNQKTSRIGSARTHATQQRETPVQTRRVVNSPLLQQQGRGPKTNRSVALHQKRGSVLLIGRLANKCVYFGDVVTHAVGVRNGILMLRCVRQAA
jgi:hypothetical protein